MHFAALARLVDAANGARARAHLALAGAAAADRSPASLLRPVHGASTASTSVDLHASATAEFVGTLARGEQLSPVYIIVDFLWALTCLSSDILSRDALAVGSSARARRAVASGEWG